MNDDPKIADDGLVGKARGLARRVWIYARSDEAKAKLAEAKKKAVEVGGAASAGAKNVWDKTGRAAAQAKGRADEFTKSDKAEQVRSKAKRLWDRIRTIEVWGIPLGASWGHPAWTRKKKVVTVLVSVLGVALLLGDISHRRAQERVARQTFAEAGSLWMAGRKAEAAFRYKTLLGDRSELLAAADRSALYHRTIEFDVNRGATEEARRLIAEARRSRIPLDNLSGRASTLLAEVGTEKRVHSPSQPDESAVDRAVAKSETEQRIDPPQQEEAPSSGETKSMMVERWGKEAERREQIAERRATRRDDRSPTRQTTQEPSTRRSENLETLTEDYYPHRPGFEKNYLTEVLMLGGLFRNWSTETAKFNGVIEEKNNKTNFVNEQGEEKALPTTFPQPKLPDQHRRKDGYIERGVHLNGEVNITWHRVLKLGAKKGDSWKQSFGTSVEEEYTVLDFTTHGSGPNAEPCAVIEKKLWFKKPEDTVMQGFTQYNYVRGIGITHSVTNMKIGDQPMRTTATTKLLMSRMTRP
jgi:hypothetical protein